MTITTAEFKVGTTYTARVSFAPGQRTQVVFRNTLTGTAVDIQRVAATVGVPAASLRTTLCDRVAVQRKAAAEADRKAASAAMYRLFADAVGAPEARNMMTLMAELTR